MRTLLLLLVAMSLGLGGSGVVRADGGPSLGPPASEMDEVVAASKAFGTAFEEKDEPAQQKIATSRDLDLVRVLGVLLHEYANVALATPPEPEKVATRLGAAEALTRLAKGNPSAHGCEQVLATWKAWDRATLEREGRLRAAADAIEAQEDKGDLEGVLGALESIRGELRPARGSLLACFLQQDMGLIAWRLGRTEQAMEATRASRALAAELPWPGGELRALRYEFSIAVDLGDLDQLEKVAREAHTLAVARGWSARAIVADIDTATHLRNGARYAQALTWAREAQALAQRVGNTHEAARALLAEAKVSAFIGSTKDAVDLAERVRRDPAHASDKPLQVEALMLCAFVTSRADRFADALSAADEALTLLEGYDEPALRATVWTNKGGYLRRMGQLEKALECQLQAVVFAERAQDRALLGTALGNLGLVQHGLGIPEYRTSLEKALEAKRKAGDQVGMLETALNYGIFQAEKPETRAQGLKLLESVTASLERARVLPQLSAALTTLAQAQGLGGDAKAALATADRALAILQGLDDRSQRRAGAHEVRAQALVMLSRPVEALEAARAAMVVRRELAAGLGEEDASKLVLNARTASDLVVACALALREQDPTKEGEVAAHAFEAVESGRATLLAAGVVQAESLLAAELPPALVSAEASARSKVSGARTRLVAASSRPTRDAATVTQATSQLDTAWKAYAEIVARIQREARRAAGVVFPAPIALEAFRKRLPPDTAYVAYQLGTAQATALVVRQEGAHLVVLEDGASLPARVEQYVSLVSAPESDELAPAAALYETLVKPLERHLTGVKRLVISPDAALTFLPFEALRRVEGEKAERLVERWEVAYAPSATVWASLEDEHAKKPASGQGFVGVGDPAYAAGKDGSAGLTPLPRSGDEVRALGALYPAKERTLLLGKDARLDRLLAALPKAPKSLRALHLACHAFVDAERPRLSSLALAGGDVLELDAIYRVRVPADLCVLSACSTARGRWLHGEGVLGFVRGFFFAGVPRVVVSDWVVEDESARALMEAFHRGMVKEKLGAAPALRQAKLAALKAGGAAAHPSSWAAFVLWGLPN